MSNDVSTETLLTGLAIGESPRWHDGRLWFCNWLTQEVVAVNEQGQRETMTHLPTDMPSSIDWLPDGRLLAISGREARLLRQEADGSLVTHADFRSLMGISNELVVDGRGHIYVNGTPFNPQASNPFGPGVIAVLTPDGSLRQVADGLAFPNGMAITPDNRTLIIAESWAHCLTAFDIADDGSLSHRRIWADLGDGAPDGICIDADGAVWYADVPHEHCIRVSEGGKLLQIVVLDRGGFACMLGGSEGKTLFIMAAEWHGFEGVDPAERAGLVATVKAPSPHAGWP